jgi:hypothetical protein
MMLEERRVVIQKRREKTAIELGNVAAGGLGASLSADHLLALIDGWLMDLDPATAKDTAPYAGRTIVFCAPPAGSNLWRIRPLISRSEAVMAHAPVAHTAQSPCR